MKIFKKSIGIVLIILMLCSTVFPAAAANYRHSEEADGTFSNINMYPVYEADFKIKASDLGLEENFEDLNDVYYYEGKIYLLSSAASQVVILNSDYTLYKAFKINGSKGEEYTLSDAQGIYVDSNGIYVSDTDNGRIFIMNQDGIVSEIMEAPKSDLIPNDFIFQPTKVGRDKEGYLYVLSLGCYYGALLYSPEGEFEGFYGSNKVQATALDTLANLWDLLTSNDVKKAASVKTLPYSFIDFCFDSNGYMVNCTGVTANSSLKGQVSKISPGGSTILFKRTADGGFETAASVNFLENETVFRENIFRYQNLVAIDVDKSGFMYALDNTYGLIYVYDRECNMITAFGGGGIHANGRLGTFDNASGLALTDNSIIVTDKEDFSFTVFKATEYGELLTTAQSMYLAGDYKEAKPMWDKVLTMDNGNQLAYRGLAMAAYTEGDLDLALNYAEKGLDYGTYDLAYQQVFKNFITNNFIWFFIGAIFLIALLVFYVRYRKNHKAKLIKNIKLKHALSVPIHPFLAYEELQYKKQFSYIIAGSIVLLLYISKVLEVTASGFLFTTIPQNNYNILYTLAQTIGLVVLWTVSNWLVCILFSGKGRFKDVFCASSYTLIPLVIYTLVRVMLSHFLSISGRSLLDAIYVIILMYTFYLLSIAMMTVHEFTFSKFILTTAISLFGMILVIFIGFMIIVLIQQFWNFIYAIYMELSFR